MPHLLISCDDHMDLGQLPADLWTTRLPASLRDRAPHIEERDGQAVWICDGKVWGTWGGKAPPTGNTRAVKPIYNAFDRGGLYDQSERRPAVSRRSEVELVDVRLREHVRLADGDDAARDRERTELAGGELARLRQLLVQRSVDRVKQTIVQFLTRVWRDGALMGLTPAQAFFVKCDRTTMTQDDIDNGRLIVLIGVAPVKPAEFVVFRIAQSRIGVDVTEG